MKRRRYWRVVFVVVGVLVLAYIAFTSVPYSVNKHYEGAIYNGSKIVQRVPVKLSGQVYRGVFHSNRFIGTLQIGQHSYSISTFRRRRNLHQDAHVISAEYPYMGAAATTNEQNFTVTTGSFLISGDFNALVASTAVISKQYGNAAELVVGSTAAHSTSTMNHTASNLPSNSSGK